MNDDNLGRLPERILIDLLVVWEPEAINSVCQVHQRFANLCRDYVWREKTLLEYHGHFKHWSTAKIDGISDWRQLHHWAHNGFVLRGHEGWVRSVAWNPDGRLASCSHDGTIRLWYTTTGWEGRVLQVHKMVFSVAWSSDGRLASDSSDGTIRLWGSFGPPKITNFWDVANGREERVLRGHTGYVESVAWSPDGRLASGSSDGTIRLWDLATGREQSVLRGHTGPVNSVAWSPDGRLASGSVDGTIRLWDLETGQKERVLRGHGSLVYSVAWSPDSSRLASGSSDGTVRLWDMATGQEKSEGS